MCCVVMTDNSEAAVVDVEGSSDWSQVGKTTTFTLSGDETYYFTAVLNDSNGNAQSGAVSSSSGTLNSDHKYTLTVTAPSKSGDYTLSVSFYTDSTKETLIDTKTAPLKAVDPVTLSATLSNSGRISVTFNAYFMVNGVIVDGSEQSVTVDANGTKTITCSYLTKDLGNDTRFCVQSDDEGVKEIISGLGNEKSFYTQQDDYTLITILVVVILIVILVFLVYIYRKPVKNTGKPKARR